MKVLIPISLMILAAACGRKEETHAPAGHTAATPIQVHVATAADADWPDSYEATGTVRARMSTTLSSKIVAHVEQVSVAVGDRVREGQALVTLDSRELEAGVRRAEAARSEILAAFIEADQGIAGAKANLGIAQATFRRIDERAGKKSVTNQELDEAAARLEGARAAHEAAQAKRRQLDSRMAQVDQEIRTASILRDYARIVAPFAGVVTAKSLEPGVLAAPGAPLLTIEREGGYRLEASVEESRLPSIRVGQTVPVRLEALNAETAARITEIVPSVDPASRTYIVKLDLPSMANLRSGVFGRAIFAAGARKVLSIPSGALIERGQLQQVFVAEDGHARLRLVTAGRRSAGYVEVLSGLTGGEKAIVGVPGDLADGAPVEVRP